MQRAPAAQRRTLEARRHEHDVVVVVLPELREGHVTVRRQAEVNTVPAVRQLPEEPRVARGDAQVVDER